MSTVDEAPSAFHIGIDDVIALGDVDDALRDFYDRQVALAAAATGVSERLIRHWIETDLIGESGFRSQALSGPGPDGSAVPQALENGYLLRAESRRGTSWYEIAHDRLVEPIQASNADWRISNLSPLQLGALEWASRDRPSSLLLRGEALSDAESWADEHRDELSDVDRDFVAASAAAVLLARRRRNRAVGVIAMVLAALLIVAIVFAAVARSQSLQAEEERRRTEAALEEVALQTELAREAQAVAEQLQAEAEQSALEANQSAGLAIESAAEATANLTEAEELRALAEEKAIEAEEQRLLAEENAATAEEQRLLAEENAATAEEQRLLAEENAAAAEAQRLLAEQNAAEAARQEALAIASAEEARLLSEDLLFQTQLAEEQRLLAEDALEGIKALLSRLPADTPTPRLTCAEEPSLISVNSAEPTLIAIENQSAIVVDVYWISYEGDRILYHTLAPGDRVEQGTFSTHPWVITNTSGTCLSVYSPLPAPTTITFIG